MNGVVSYLVIRTDSSVVFFFIGDFLYGCCGSLPTMTMSCFAYIAERTPAEKRMLRITLLQLCLLVSGMLTAIVIGPLMFEVGKDNAVLIAFFIGIINFAYVFLFLRNSDQKVDEEPIVTEDQSTVHGHSCIHSDNGASLIGQGMQPVTDLDTSGYAFETSGSGDHEHPPGLPRFRHVAHQTNNNVVDGNAQPESEKSRVELQTRQLCNSILRVGSLFLYPGPHRFRLNILMATFFVSVLPTFDNSLENLFEICLLYTSPSPRDRQKSRMPSSA